MFLNLLSVYFILKRDVAQNGSTLNGYDPEWSSDTTCGDPARDKVHHGAQLPTQAYDRSRSAKNIQTRKALAALLYCYYDTIFLEPRHFIISELYSS